MLLPFLGFIIGIISLMKLSDYAVDYSVELSKLTGIMKLTIGIVVIALMTSLPELAIAITSSLSKASNIVFGTMLGSNIADILLVLGGAAAVYGIGVSKRYLKSAGEIMILTAGLLIYGIIYQYDIVFGLLSIIIFGFLSDRLLHHNVKKERVVENGFWKSLATLVKLVIVIVLIILSAELVTRSTIEISNILGISETLIGATIISITTSFPELMVALSAARKKEMEIIFGTVFGSCFVNIAFILGLSSILSVITISAREMFLLAYLLITYFIAFLLIRYKLDRFEGIVMLFLYLLFILLMSSFG